MSHPGPPAVEIELTDAERARLTGVSVESSRVAVRARIVLACAEGASNAQVARQLGIAVATVRRWRGAFAAGGLDTLLDAPRDGRPKAELAVTAQERAILQRWAQRAKSSQVLAVRSKIVLACADGKASKQIAGQLEADGSNDYAHLLSGEIDFRRQRYVQAVSQFNQIADQGNFEGAFRRVIVFHCRLNL